MPQFSNKQDGKVQLQDHEVYSNGADRKKIIYIVGGILCLSVMFGIGFLMGWFINRGVVNQGQQNGNLCPTMPPTKATTPPPTTATNATQSTTGTPPPTTKGTTVPGTFPPSDICSTVPTPLIVIAINGFRRDYLNRGQSPILSDFATKGVQADFLKPSFPTQTLPNLYTIATGLYPANHGIVANNFYDPTLDENFNAKSVNASQQKWWGGEPIWITAKKNNLKTASYSWPGDRVNFQGYQPDYRPTKILNATTLDRVAKFFEWIDMPSVLRPRLITMTFDSLEKVGAMHGPTSTEVNQEIKNIDNAIGKILNGLKLRKVENCVNIIITSDHGMKQPSCTRIRYLNTYIDVDKNTIVNQGAFGGILVNGGNATQVVAKIKGRSSKFTVFKKEDLPFRFHYNSKRVPDVLVLMTDGYLARRRYDANYTACKMATSGWDNLEADMRTIFMASGPGFNTPMTIKSFLNTQLYNVMATLLNIKPAKNDGVLGSLRTILKSPGNVVPQLASQLGPVCRIPDSLDLFDDRVKCSKCVCPYCRSVVKANLTLFNQALNMSMQEESMAETMNFPWGIPQYHVPLDTCTLYQNYYITGYSNTYRVPWFIGYEITSQEAAGGIKRNDCFRRDLRLSIATQASNCTNYQRSGYDRGHMAPNGDMSFDQEAQANTYLLSNIAPQIHNFNAGPWLNLESLTRTWAKKYGSVFVISGSLVLGDHSTVWSDPSYWIHNAIDTVVLPTHFYKIFTKCQTTKSMLGNTESRATAPCQGKLDVLSFILPHLNSRRPQGQPTDTYLLDHVASVRDIETLAGINFFPDLPSDVQDSIEIPIPSSLWPK